MATIVGSGSVGNDMFFRYAWEGLANGDDGRPLRVSGLADKTVMVDGTFGASGEVTVEGSMDGAAWATLNDPQGAALVLTAAGGAVIAENPKFIRPNITNGDGTTALNVRVGASALV